MVGYPDRGEGGKGGVGRGHVMGQAGLDAGEEEDLDEGEGGPGAEGRSAQGGDSCGGVEQHPRWGREEQDAEVIPPGGKMSVKLVGDAPEDVEAEVLADENLAVEVEHVQMPGKG